MNNPTKSAPVKTEERKKRLEAALKRNILRRKTQLSQRHEIKTPETKPKGDNE